MNDVDTTAEMFPPSPTAEESTAPESPPHPRIRWAGIVWGFVLAAVAATGLAVTWGPTRLDDLATVVPQLTVSTVVAAALMTLGALALITGLVGLLRRGQRAAARGRK
ncbi:hypothetical protein ITJ43_05130 [Microbacterium sp. VKM Ac-2870]|uniref:hypothetical protein n=1 Tax=Microbacterium sp. VKM Ac-2870 TaxID=2783825 RepID=UPI00188B9E07|nr:hypothetical protein [Microbacterium sp. VKM Ac-2870]MBF4561513.1 hypothetical protein [Microbacterium sp. VKM Ac-2870]